MTLLKEPTIRAILRVGMWICQVDENWPEL